MDAQGTQAGVRYEILVSCTDLANMDNLSKSDPMCVLFFKHFGQWKEIGRTEAIRNTLNPKFVGTFVLDFDPVLQQNFMFSIYDIDNRSTDLKDHDFVGSTELSSLALVDPELSVCSICRTLRTPGNAKGRGLISITSERMRESRDKVSLHVGSHKLNKKGKIMSRKPDVYLEISRSIDNVTFHPVHRTETQHKTQHPRWRPFELGLQRLCNGDWDRLLEFSVWHHSGAGDYKMLGRRVTTLRELNILRTEGHYKELSLGPRKDGNMKNSIKITNCGFLRFYKIRVDCNYSLLDYVRGGMQLNLYIAIDFTSSNGKLGEKMSLHDTSDDKTTPYMEVINSLGGLILPYCPNDQMKMLGFGAKLKRSKETNFCFPLSRDWNNFAHTGLQEANEVYKKATKRVKFSGPTRVKPLLSLVESLCSHEPTQDQQAYNVLIVITDGVLNDFDEVMEKFVSISHLPLTVVFAGVGLADLSHMECFCHDHHSMLAHKGNRTTSTRRHTHFVMFPRESGGSNNTDTLARDTFAIICTQIVDYMRKRDIVPNQLPKYSQASSRNSFRDLNLSQVRPGLKKSPSRTSLISRNSLNVGSDPKCPTCGSILLNEANTFFNSSANDLISVE